MTPLNPCDTDKGCAPVQVLFQKTAENERRITHLENEDEKLHSRITDEIKQKVSDNKAWMIALFNTIVTLALLALSLLKS